MPAPHLFGKTHTALNRDRRGFSIRKHLANQGVHSEADVRKHLTFIAETMKINPQLDLTRYKVHPTEKSEPYHG